MVANDYGAMRVLLRDGDPDLELILFSLIAEDSAEDADEQSQVSAMDPKVLFFLRWAEMLCMVLSTVIRLRELKPLIRQHARSRDGRSWYLRMPKTLDETYYVGVGRAVVLQELTSKSLVGKSDPISVTSYDRCGCVIAACLLPVWVCAWLQRLRTNRNYANTEHDLDHMTFDMI